MKMKSLLLAAACLLAPLAPASAQDYPTRPVSVIVPFSAGGTVDILGRMVGEHLQKKFGPAFLIENVGGAGSIIGVTRIARAAPDGTTPLSPATPRGSTASPTSS